MEISYNEDREERIGMEAIVDAHDSEELAMGWYYHLEDKLRFPFKAKCIAKRKSSPLKIGDDIEVLSMEIEESEHEMYVLVRWSDMEIAIPLVQISPGEVDEETREGVEDWHYWMARGYEF